MKKSFFNRVGKKRPTTSTINERSSIDATKRLFNDKTNITHLSQEKEEESEAIKIEKLLDKITVKAIENKQLQTGTISKPLPIIDYCIENSEADFDFFTQMTSTNNTLNQFAFTSPKEEGEKCQLVEKSIIDKLKNENEDLSSKLTKMNKKIDETKKKLFIASGESNFTKQASDYQKRLKNDNTRQLNFLNETLFSCTDHNKNLREKLTEKIIEKDSLFRAVFNYLKKIDEEMAEEFGQLYECYNNQYYLCENKNMDEKYIDDLFGEINAIDRKIAIRCNEIKELEKFIMPEKKNKKKRGSAVALLQPLTEANKRKSLPKINPLKTKEVNKKEKILDLS